jgi:hypothetical protein
MSDGITPPDVEGEEGDWSGEFSSSDDSDAMYEALTAGIQDEDGDFLPTISIDTDIDRAGLINNDSFSIVWYPLSSDSDFLLYPSRVADATFDTGEMTIYKEVVADYAENHTSGEMEATGEYWNIFQSMADTSFSTTEDEDESTAYTTVFSISLDTDEANALEDKYSQTDYSIEDIDDNIGSAFSSTISSILSSAYRIPTKQTWRKQKQKPLRERNETSMDRPRSEG